MFNSLNVNPNLIQNGTRDSYLDSGDKGTDKPKIILDLTKGVHPLLPIETLQEYNRTSMDRVLAQYGYEYMDLSPAGKYEEFKQTICKKFAKHGFSFDQILLGHGSFHIVERIFTKALRTGTKLLGVGPQFNELPDEFRRMEGNSYETAFSADDFTPQLDRLAGLLEKSENVSGIYLDNPNNPTGKALDQEKLKTIIEVAQKKGILVVIDEAYGDFLTDEQSGMKYVTIFDNVLVVRSMSKGYGLARDRIGYALGNVDLIKGLSPIFVPFEPSEKSLVLGNMIMQDYPSLSTDEVVKKKRKFLTLLEQKTGIRHADTELSTPILAAIFRDNIHAALGRIGINTIPGSSFNQTNPHMTDNVCRIVIPKDDGKFDKLMELVGNAEEVKV